MNGSPIDGLEIERKWLLHRLPARLEDPARPPGAGDERWEIRQGYLGAPSESDLAAAAQRAEAAVEGFVLRVSKNYVKVNPLLQ